jgi:hypothetical protein
VISSSLPLVAATYAYLLPIRGTGELNSTRHKEETRAPLCHALSLWSPLTVSVWEHQLSDQVPTATDWLGAACHLQHLGMAGRAWRMGGLWSQR